jgi:hypothetical protein
MAQSAVAAMEPQHPQVIVIGFVGGWVRASNLVHSEVQLATRLRAEYPSGVYTEVFENHEEKKAHQEVLRLLDTSRDGGLSPEEKQAARVIVYGHSWGGSEAVTLARKLQEDGIPVLLTVQVDSIRKWHENDSLIPANVREAANFYQPHGLVHGERAIRAADPARTKIVGNFRFDYADKPFTCTGYSWWDRNMARDHTKMECDPAVWARVESLIRDAIRSALPGREVASREASGTQRMR